MNHLFDVWNGRCRLFFFFFFCQWVNTTVCSSGFIEGAKPHSSFCVPRSASWRCAYLSNWSRSPASTSSTAWCCAAWKRGTTWRTNRRRSGSPWRTGSPMMPCKDPLLWPPSAALKSILENHLHKYTPLEIKWIIQLAVFFLDVLPIQLNRSLLCVWVGGT